MSRVEGNLQGLIVRMEQAGEKAVRGISDTFQTNGELIRDAAIEYSPILTGALEHAIKKNTEYTGINRRAVVTVYIDESGPVGKYARLIHESLQPYGSGMLNLGKLSAEKDGGRGIVGGKFLQRAFRLYKEKVQRDAQRVAERAFKE